MLTSPGASDVEKPSLSFVDVVQFCFIGSVFNALIEWQNAFVTGHHDNGTKFQTLGEAHLRRDDLICTRQTIEGCPRTRNKLRGADEHSDFTGGDPFTQPCFDRLPNRRCLGSNGRKRFDFGRRTVENGDDPATLVATRTRELSM